MLLQSVFSGGISALGSACGVRRHQPSLLIVIGYRAEPTFYHMCRLGPKTGRFDPEEATKNRFRGVIISGDQTNRGTPTFRTFPLFKGDSNHLNSSFTD